MKYISRILFFSVIAAAMFACNKVADLPSYQNGTAPVLTASTTTATPVASDSNNVVLTLNWTDAKHATDSTHVKYTIEIDSTGKNFKNPFTTVVMTSHSKAFIAKDLNNYLVGRGYAFNVPVDLDMRVTSSYANNNERLTSNVVKLRFTPYKVPPKVALPTSSKLFLVGDATQGGWNNPVPTPSQEFARLDETTWAGVFNLVGGKQYLMLPVNGDWSHKFAVANNTVAGLSAGGDFGFDLSDNFPGPATSGLYKIVVDFQHGKFTVTPYTGGYLPTTLYIVGDATAGGWNNPVPVPSQRFTQVNSSVWQITLPMTGGNQFLILPTNGDWSKKFALKDNSVAGISAGGEFGFHQDGMPAPDDFQQNFKAPATSGTYTITLNLAAPTTTPRASGVFTIQ